MCQKYIKEDFFMDFNNSKTKENLARLFAGECQDGARYQFIAKKSKSRWLFLYKRHNEIACKK